MYERASERARGGGDVKICLREQNQSSEMHPADRPSERERASTKSAKRAAAGGAHVRRRRRTPEASITEAEEREREREGEGERDREREGEGEGAHCQFRAAEGPTKTTATVVLHRGSRTDRDRIRALTAKHLCVKKQCCGEKGMVHFLSIKPNQREWKQIARFIHFLVPGSIPDSLHGRVDIIWSQSSSASNGPNAV